jgi:hypothetical protein
VLPSGGRPPLLDLLDFVVESLLFGHWVSTGQMFDVTLALVRPTSLAKLCFGQKSFSSSDNWDSER